jgi:hypothetical protein
MEITACKAHGDNNELSRLPWLADPLLKFDISRELLELRSKDSWGRETGRSSKTLAKHSDFRVVLVLMKANTKMNQHQAEGRISIQQISGRMLVRLPDQEVTLDWGTSGTRPWRLAPHQLERRERLPADHPVA